jgi:Zn-dependent membrane protease YugP
MRNLSFNVVWFLCLAVFIARVWARGKMKRNYYRYLGVKNSARKTGKEFVAETLKKLRIADVEVALSTDNTWRGNNYGARRNKIRLANQILSSASISALCVSAHEIGHALQRKDGDWRISAREILTLIFLIIWAIWFVGALIVFAIGCVNSGKFVLDLFANLDSEPAVKLFFNSGVALFLVYALYCVIQLPIEFDASRRAFDLLEDYISPEEKRSVLKVLNSISLFYLATPFPF